MIGVGETLPDFKVVGVKPRFMRHEEKGESAFETLTKASFPGKWKVIFFYPKKAGTMELLENQDISALPMVHLMVHL